MEGGQGYFTRLQDNSKQIILEGGQGYFTRLHENSKQIILEGGQGHFTRLQDNSKQIILEGGDWPGDRNQIVDWGNTCWEVSTKIRTILVGTQINGHFGRNTK